MDLGGVGGASSRYPVVPPAAGGAGDVTPTLVERGEAATTALAETDKQVVGKLQELDNSSRIVELASEASGQDLKTMWAALTEIAVILDMTPDNLLEGYRDREHLGIPAALEAQKQAAEGRIPTLREDLGISASADLGGHGGTLTAKVKVGKADHYVFLKPLDEIELANYRSIQQHCPGLSARMPHVYGTVKMGGQEFLVMQNTRMGGEGQELEQAVDAKMSGEVAGLDNPIYNSGEYKATHGGQAKNAVDAIQMGVGARRAGHFMVAQGRRAFRLLHYGDSAQAYQRALADMSPDDRASVRRQLVDMKQELGNSPFAFAGTSVVIIREAGAPKVYLIDPAHMLVKPGADQAVGGYRPEDVPNDFTLQHESNRVALDALIDATAPAVGAAFRTKQAARGTFSSMRTTLGHRFGGLRGRLGLVR